MASQQQNTSFPSSASALAASPDTLEQLRATARAFAIDAKQDPDVLKRYKDRPMDVFLEYAPEHLRTQFNDTFLNKINMAILSEETYRQRLSDAQHVMTYVASRQLKQQELLGAGWGKAFCEIGLWSAIVLALGAAIAISQGALIAPLITVDAGIVPVLAAITGLSQNWILAMAAAGGFTFGKLIDAACS